MSLVDAVNAAGVAPDASAAQSLKKRYSEVLSSHLAVEVADGLRSVGFQGIKPTRGGPGERAFQGGLGSAAGKFKWGTAVQDIREQLRRKAKSYGTPPFPLVIAVNVLDWTYTGHGQVAQALFGTLREKVTVTWPSRHVKTPHVAEPIVVQERDGLLFDGKTPHYRAVAADDQVTIEEKFRVLADCGLKLKDQFGVSDWVQGWGRERLDEPGYDLALVC